MSSPDCSICARHQAVQENRHPHFIAELESGVVCLGDHQLYPGYCLFLCKDHVRELPQLPDDRCRLFLWEMSRLAQSILFVCRPRKLNYEMLGNQDAHLHWHLFPRYPDDPSPLRPVWADIEGHLRDHPAAPLGIDTALSPEDQAMKTRILYHLRQSGVTVVRAF
jgi:diadenosine tetraphosphate (Ap4A) HIT family hydrolase